MWFVVIPNLLPQLPRTRHISSYIVGLPKSVTEWSTNFYTFFSKDHFWKNHSDALLLLKPEGISKRLFTLFNSVWYPQNKQLLKHGYMTTFTCPKLKFECIRHQKLMTRLQGTKKIWEPWVSHLLPTDCHWCLLEYWYGYPTQWAWLAYIGANLLQKHKEPRCQGDHWVSTGDHALELRDPWSCRWRTVQHGW